MAIREAIILAGGLGTRLRSAVPDLPKCMAPVAGKPFLHYVINYLQNQGIQQFIFAVGYKYEFIEKFLDDEASKINYQLSIEKEPLGTGGAIKLACKKAAERNVLVLNGDTFFKIKVDVLATFHEKNDSDCTLSLKPMKNFDRYGVVNLNQNFSINDFQEKRFYKTGLINGGVYALNKETFLKEDLPEKFSFEKDYLEKLYSKRKMFGVIQDEYFIDIGIPEDYERAQEEMKHEA